MEDTIKLTKRLEKIFNSPDEDPDITIKYMERLSEIDMNIMILTKTGVGLIINKFRKRNTHPSVTNAAKQLIKQWKKLVPKNESKSSKRKIEDASSPRESDNASSDDDKGNKRPRFDMDESSNHSSISASGNKESNSKKSVNFSRSTVTPHQETNDPFRLKAREMILKSLTKDEIPEGSFDPDYLSVQIETAIFNIFLNTDKDYKQRVRTRVMNLRDQNNPELRFNVLTGSFSAEKLANCTSEEMASKEMQQLRMNYMKEIINESQLSTGGGTESSILKCPRCRKSRCSYNQLQTRSSDEPMTTFAFCNECGHRWKFN